MMCFGYIIPPNLIHQWETISTKNHAHVSTIQKTLEVAQQNAQVNIFELNTSWSLKNKISPNIRSLLRKKRLVSHIYFFDKYALAEYPSKVARLQKGMTQQSETSLYTWGWFCDLTSTQYSWIPVTLNTWHH